MPGPRYFGELMAGRLGFGIGDFQEDWTLWMARVHPDDVDAVCSHSLAVLAEGRSSVEYRWRCADKSERTFLDHAVLIPGEGKEPAKLAGLCLDISDNRSGAQRARPFEPGRLSGPVAHDLNNMLMVAIWGLNLLGRTRWDTQKGRERLRTTLEAAQSCSTLFNQMLRTTPQADLLEVRRLETGRMALVVEGNATLRQIVTTQLADLGYRAMGAASAQPALDILRAQPVDLLLADEAPSDGIDADRLRRSALEIRPALKMISTSDRPNCVKSDLFLPKPYELVDLRHAVRSITFNTKIK